MLTRACLIILIGCAMVAMSTVHVRVGIPVPPRLTPPKSLVLFIRRYLVTISTKLRHFRSFALRSAVIISALSFMLPPILQLVLAQPALPLALRRSLFVARFRPCLRLAIRLRLPRIGRLLLRFLLELARRPHPLLIGRPRPRAGARRLLPRRTDLLLQPIDLRICGMHLQPPSPLAIMSLPALGAAFWGASLPSPRRRGG